MSTGQQQQPQQQQREQPVATRDGSRWLHYPPNEEQVREWFGTQPIHPGMDHGPYLGGIVVIGASERIKITKWKQNGDPYLTEVERAVFIPYVKVDTRIAYFHDLVAKLNEGAIDAETEGASEAVRSLLRRRIDGPFVGIIEPVPQKRITDKTSAFYNEHLPDGFSVQAVRNKDDSVTRYIVATFCVSIYERESWNSKVNGRDPVPLLQGIGSKQSLLAKTWADDNSMMKAETGAIGRALGVAGILVVGTGVATAEDVQEAQAGSGGAAAAQGGEKAELPPVVDREGQPAAAQAASGDPGQAVAADETPESADEAKRTHALALQAEMERDYPDTWTAYKAWWGERKFGPLSTLSGPALNGAVIKLERDLDAAKNAPAAPDA